MPYPKAKVQMKTISDRAFREGPDSSAAPRLRTTRVDTCLVHHDKDQFKESSGHGSRSEMTTGMKRLARTSSQSICSFRRHTKEFRCFDPFRTMEPTQTCARPQNKSSQHSLSQAKRSSHRTDRKETVKNLRGKQRKFESKAERGGARVHVAWCKTRSAA